MSDKITTLKENEIFVFGSNYAGRHGKGAALTALRKFGAIKGQGTGLMGKSYGIATKDRNMRTLSLSQIESQVSKFIAFAHNNPSLTFLVTPIGCGLAGYKPKEIAPMFKNIPLNIVLPTCFSNQIGKG
jgi:hypothetical protein